MHSLFAYRTLCLLLFLKLFPTNCLAQGFGAWESLYKDKVIEVEVSFKIVDASCANSKKHLIKYRVNGKLSSFDDYLIWTTDYIDCYGNNIFKEHSLNISVGAPSANGNAEAVGDTWTLPDDEFLADKIITKFYDAHTSNSPSNKSGIKKNINSETPEAITGKLSIICGTNTYLSVKGILGSDPSNEWVWYEDQCGGKKMDSGILIILSPKETTTYFVRAEGKNTTKCAQVTVNVNSKEPESISGKSSIYIGEAVNLEEIGGILTTTSGWVWYQDNCNGKKVGVGSSLKVSPTITTTYFVRAQGENNNSKCVQKTITVLSKDPDFISGKNDIFFTESTALSVIGGFLDVGNEWVWYKDQIGGNKINTGSFISVTPLETTTYYVRAEGKSSPTNYAQRTVYVNQAIPAPRDKNSPDINNINFSNNNDRIEITYDIINFKPFDEFFITLSGYNKNGERLNINSLSGDLSNVKGGNSKKIIWDSKRDGYQFDEKIYFNIVATKKINIPFGTHVIKSIAFPGWGDINLKSKRKATLLYGLSGFALIGTSVLLNQQAIQSYSSYEKSFDVNQSNKYYNDAVLKRNLSRIAALSATLVWTIDLAGLYRKYDKVQKNPTKENIPYYYDQSQKVINTNSKLLLINTKSK